MKSLTSKTNTQEKHTPLLTLLEK